MRLVENRAVRKALDDLKTLGIAIALDDFGTGNSSLSYLRAFPFDKIKIDLCFVCDLGQGAPAQAIVDALLALAGDLGMTTTAEGVEADWQRAWLQTKGCTEAQGYFFGRPMPAAEVPDFLASRPRYAANGHKD